MNFANLFNRRNSPNKEYPLKIKTDANKESNESMKKINDYIKKYTDKAKDDGVIAQISKNPDLVIKDIIAYVIRLTQRSNAFTSQKIVDDITENQSIDSADMMVALMIINERNKIIEQLHSFEGLSLISKEKKQMISTIISRSIGICEAIKHVSKITRTLYYGWSNYFDSDNDIKLEKINSIIYNNRNRLSGNFNFIGGNINENHKKYIENIE